jgi:hypothetical protein
MPTKPGCKIKIARSPGMPFAEPETHLPATIDPLGRGKSRHHKKCAPWGVPEALYDFSITYTKAQRLTESEPAS